MKRLLVFSLSSLLGAVLPVWFVLTAHAQQAQTSAKLNPQIEKIVGEISAANIETIIRKQVSFGTRHTMSLQDDPVRGIGAALDQCRRDGEHVIGARGARGCRIQNGAAGIRHRARVEAECRAGRRRVSHRLARNSPAVLAARR